MKVYLFEEDNGIEYDGYDHWVSKAFLVPDDFVESVFQVEFHSYLKSSKLVRFNKDGRVHYHDLNKCRRIYQEYFSRAFEEIKIANHE